MPNFPKKMILFLFLSTLFWASSPAMAACVPGAPGVGNCINQPCNEIGASTMDFDQKNIIVCLKNDIGAKIWKSTTSAAGTPKLKNCYWSAEARPGTACSVVEGFIQAGTKVHFNGHAEQNYCCRLVIE